MSSRGLGTLVCGSAAYVVLLQRRSVSPGRVERPPGSLVPGGGGLGAAVHFLLPWALPPFPPSSSRRLSCLSLGTGFFPSCSSSSRLVLPFYPPSSCLLSRPSLRVRESRSNPRYNTSPPILRLGCPACGHNRPRFVLDAHGPEPPSGPTRPSQTHLGSSRRSVGYPYCCNWLGVSSSMTLFPPRRLLPTHSSACRPDLWL